MGAHSSEALAVAAFVLDCRDPRELAEFYGELLGWAVDERSSNERWVELADPAEGAVLAFQADPDFEPPTWPTRQRQQMAHLDVRVPSLAEGHELAVRVGARQLPQPADQRDARFRVYADPAGHPFCLCAPPDV